MDFNKLLDKGVFKFNDTITSFRFKKKVGDLCIYGKSSGSKFKFLVLYVEVILVAANGLGILHERRFSLKEL